jgi:hypothetical protein
MGKRRSKLSGCLAFLLADEKSELAVSRMGGASSRLWQPDAVCLVEEPPSGSASRLCAELEIARGFADAVSGSHTQCQGGLTGGLPRVPASIRREVEPQGQPRRGVEGDNDRHVDNQTFDRWRTAYLQARQSR